MAKRNDPRYYGRKMAMKGETLMATLDAAAARGLDLQEVQRAWYDIGEQAPPVEYLASRQWDARTRYYVASTPTGREDWGYTEKATQACALSRYWARRFRADCRRVGAVARFTPELK